MKNEIIQLLIIKLQNTLGITAMWEDSGILDGQFVFNIEAKKVGFTILIRKELRQYQISEFVLLQEKYKNLMIVAENIFPKIKEELKVLNIAYLETNGNMFIKEGGVYLYIDTNITAPMKNEKANRAFTKTGLIVIFHFLIDKHLINKKQRDIANITGVALGNIPQVIKGLKETGYILALNKKEFVWENRIELLNKWINKYASDLRPKIIKGNYSLHSNWETLKLDHTLSVWGGEPAADLLTNHLRPEKYILYTKENQLDLMKKYRLRPNENGEVVAMKMFWNNANSQMIAPPILVYAELILEGGKRNIETAQKIYNEFIEPNL